jgi:hypothetical protein
MERPSNSTNRVVGSAVMSGVRGCCAEAHEDWKTNALASMSHNILSSRVSSADPGHFATRRRFSNMRPYHSLFNLPLRQRMADNVQRFPKAREPTAGRRRAFHRLAQAFTFIACGGKARSAAAENVC